jgi:hypothetical protein
MDCQACGRRVGSEYSIDSVLCSTTHDTGITRHHVQLSKWLDQLSAGIEAAWPKRRARYSNVAVLMLSWEETDIRYADKEIRRLESVFRDAYKYEVSHWKIPMIDPDIELHDRVREFLRDFGRRDNLLIVYYAGHARPGSQAGDAPFWQPK